MFLRCQGNLFPLRGRHSVGFKTNNNPRMPAFGFQSPPFLSPIFPLFLPSSPLPFLVRPLSFSFFSPLKSETYAASVLVRQRNDFTFLFFLRRNESSCQREIDPVICYLISIRFICIRSRMTLMTQAIRGLMIFFFFLFYFGNCLGPTNRGLFTVVLIEPVNLGVDV